MAPDTAARRSTSVYVPGRVEPMLPEALSNDACSLRPHADRLAVTVRMDVGSDGTVRRVQFLAPMEAALLSTRRSFAPQGIQLLEIRRGNFAPEGDQGDMAAVAQLHIEHRLTDPPAAPT